MNQVSCNFLPRQLCPTPDLQKNNVRTLLISLFFCLQSCFHGVCEGNVSGSSARNFPAVWHGDSWGVPACPLSFKTCAYGMPFWLYSSCSKSIREARPIWQKNTGTSLQRWNQMLRRKENYKRVRDGSEAQQTALITQGWICSSHGLREAS